MPLCGQGPTSGRGGRGHQDSSASGGEPGRGRRAGPRRGRRAAHGPAPAPAGAARLNARRYLLWVGSSEPGGTTEARAEGPGRSPAQGPAGTPHKAPRDGSIEQQRGPIAGHRAPVGRADLSRWGPVRGSLSNRIRYCLDTIRHNSGKRTAADPRCRGYRR